MPLDLSQTPEQRDLILCLDSDRVSEGSIVPSLTSAFSVSSTFCPLISRWITLWAWRWARPWDKRWEKSAVVLEWMGRWEETKGRLALSPFRVRLGYKPHPPTAQVQTELSWVCVHAHAHAHGECISVLAWGKGWEGAPGSP